MEIVRLGQGVDRTGRLAPEALERTLAACARVRRAVPRARASSGSGSSRRRPPATRATAASSSPACATALGVEPEVVTGDEEAALSFPGATGELPAHGVAGPVPRRRHRRRLDRVRPRHRLDVEAGPVGRHRLRADDRAAPAQRPADRRRDRGRHAPTSTPRSTRRRATVDLRAGARRSSGSPARSPRSRRIALRPAGVRPRRASTSPRCRSTQVVAACDRAAGDDPRRARRAAGSCTPAGSTSSAPGRWSGAGSSSGCARAGIDRGPGVSEHDILDGIALSLA